jgi:hypothetical protein
MHPRSQHLLPRIVGPIPRHTPLHSKERLQLVEPFIPLGFQRVPRERRDLIEQPALPLGQHAARIPTALVTHPPTQTSLLNFHGVRGAGYLSRHPPSYGDELDEITVTVDPAEPTARIRGHGWSLCCGHVAALLATREAVQKMHARRHEGAAHGRETRTRDPPAVGKPDANESPLSQLE